MFSTKTLPLRSAHQRHLQDFCVLMDSKLSAAMWKIAFVQH